METNNHTVTAVIVAAGNGVRLGGVTKCLIDLGGGVTVLERVLNAFTQAKTIKDIVLVCRATNEITSIVARCKKEIKIVKGGATRSESVKNGVDATTSRFVCIHDCARPFITAEDIDKVVTVALDTGAASACSPVYNTIKYTYDGNQTAYTPDRDKLISVQTPQVFYRDVYLVAYVKAKADRIRSTDDTTIAEHAGFRVDYVPIGTHNFKLTDTSDVKKAKALVFLENRGLK